MDYMINPRKAAVIGCGNVGASIAFALMQRALFSELVLIDSNVPKAEGEAMDLSHGLPYTASMDIYAGTYEQISDCALIAVTAGANQKPGETRLDLITKNISILREVLGEITATAFEGILLVVSNPVDILTYEAQRISGYPSGRVIGSGTVLDTARLKYELGRRLGVDSRNVHAFIIGEHGDSELPVFSGANISGIDLDQFFKLRGQFSYRNVLNEIFEDVRTSAYAIIDRKGSTYYGIAMAAARIAQCIVRDEQAVLPVSVILDGAYGLSGLALSVPAILGKDGVESVLEIPLSARERSMLSASADALKRVIEVVDAGKMLV
jgi:L-lactate dehydrogenase